MEKYICIHGHFYQPPRENPWLESIEQQDSAYPYHDWNERITTECYAPNSLARILGPYGKIVNITNNYSNISFNFGPTLLSWLEKNDKDTYQAILTADKESQDLFSGHGSALAQCYNHMIMPLSNALDRYTQVYWGIKDFEFRFKRKPEGMWLPETAVDLKTLDILAEQGILFTILAPNQAKRIRKENDTRWKDVSEGKIDPRYPYLCKLPSGRTISLFFYDGPVSHAVAFEKLLIKGEYLAERLLDVFTSDDEDQLVHVATDGETYGHHHQNADMALAYCINYIREKKRARVTIYGEYLANHQPRYQVEIYENSSWSCSHGIERWRNNCGCTSGNNRNWNQEWRAPLRGALDWLRDTVQQIYEVQIKKYVNDPWRARNEYIDIVLNRTQESVNVFFKRNMTRKLSAEERVIVLQLMEMQRNEMLMYTSCGWFFDEISGIETLQILRYAARVIQLVDRVVGIKLEEIFLNIIEKAPSNIPQYSNGKYVYEKFVKPEILDLIRIGSHYAIASMVKKRFEQKHFYCHSIKNDTSELTELGKQKLAVGKTRISSDLTEESADIIFAVLHLGDHNFISGVARFNLSNKEFKEMNEKLIIPFKKSDIAGTVSVIDAYFIKQNQFSLWDLFKDEQIEILGQILGSTLKDVDASLRQINDRYYPIIQVLQQFNRVIPRQLVHTLSATMNSEIIEILQNDPINIDKLKYCVSQLKGLALDIDQVMIAFLVRKKVNQLMNSFEQDSRNPMVLERVVQLLHILEPLSLNINFWKAQNIYYSVGKRVIQSMKKKAKNMNPSAKKWLEHFNYLSDSFNIRVE
ncbi:MAG: DUF3536 domain-containing protein [Chitinispirillia bacterium]